MSLTSSCHVTCMMNFFWKCSVQKCQSPNPCLKKVILIWLTSLFHEPLPANHPVYAMCFQFCFWNFSDACQCSCSHPHSFNLSYLNSPLENFPKTHANHRFIFKRSSLVFMSKELGCGVHILALQLTSSVILSKLWISQGLIPYTGFPWWLRW